jgi:hypothetical protein
VRRETIWEGLERIRIPNGRRIKKICDYCLSAVQVGNEYSEWFETQTGVRQGRVLSPVLFNVVTVKITEIVSGQVRDKNVIYAGDIQVWEEIEESVERELSKLQSNLEEKRLEISTEKTVVMKISQNQEICREIKCNGHALKVVDNIKYFLYCNKWSRCLGLV